jgi:hypothetical protein
VLGALPRSLKPLVNQRSRSDSISPEVWRVVAVAILGPFISTLDATVVNVSLSGWAIRFRRDPAARKASRIAIANAFRAKRGMATIRYKMGHLVLWAVRLRPIDWVVAEHLSRGTQIAENEL